MPDKLLDVKDLTVAFASGKGYAEVVSGISFHLFPGEVLALVGESGCGKSSACLALTGLLGGKNKRSGQVMFEYVVMLVFALVLILALSTLYTVATDRGHRMVDSVSWNIP